MKNTSRAANRIKYCIFVIKIQENIIDTSYGGYTSKTTFEVRKIELDLRGFFGIGDVAFSIDNVELEEWLEKGFFPIACDSFGNYIVIGLRNWKSGKIYFCDHEKGYKAEYLTGNLQFFLML